LRYSVSHASKAGDADLSAAIVVWTGGGADYWPLLDDRRVIDHYGMKTASLLLPILRALKEEFYASDASRRASDLTEMG
jgi:hypothetical protein